MEFGVQQLQLGKVLSNKKNALNALKIIQTSGYDGIELNGFMIRKSPWIVKLLTSMSGMPIKNSGKMNWKELLDQVSLKVFSIHEDIDTLEKRLDDVVKEATLFHTHNIVLTGLYQFEYSSKKEVLALAERLNKIGKNLSEHGLTFLYHNHNVEFVHVTPDRLAYDFIIESTNPDYVSFEFDSYWPSISGVDALFYMKKLGKRQKLHHICDHGNLSHKKFMTPIISNEAVELGTGNLNLLAFLKQDQENEVEAVILEQHKHYLHKNPIESLCVSFDFISQYKREQKLFHSHQNNH